MRDHDQELLRSSGSTQGRKGLGTRSRSCPETRRNGKNRRAGRPARKRRGHRYWRKREIGYRNGPACWRWTFPPSWVWHDRSGWIRKTGIAWSGRGIHDRTSLRFIRGQEPRKSRWTQRRYSPAHQWRYWIDRYGWQAGRAINQKLDAGHGVRPDSRFIELSISPAGITGRTLFRFAKSNSGRTRRE